MVKEQSFLFPVPQIQTSSLRLWAHKSNQTLKIMTALCIVDSSLLSCWLATGVTVKCNRPSNDVPSNSEILCYRVFAWQPQINQHSHLVFPQFILTLLCHHTSPLTPNLIDMQLQQSTRPSANCHWMQSGLL